MSALEQFFIANQQQIYAVLTAGLPSFVLAVVSHASLVSHWNVFSLDYLYLFNRPGLFKTNIKVLQYGNYGSILFALY